MGFDPGALISYGGIALVVLGLWRQNYLVAAAGAAVFAFGPSVAKAATTAAQGAAVPAAMPDSLGQQASPPGTVTVISHATGTAVTLPTNAIGIPLKFLNKP